jgi:exonuclease III
MTLAERLHRLGTETAFTVSLAAAEWGAKGNRIYPFHLGDLDLATPSNVIAAMDRAVADGKTGYCPAAGIAPLREALAHDIGSRRGLSYAPSQVVVGWGDAEFDAEGRYLELRFDTPKRKFSVISCYFPSGSSGEERQLAKFRFLKGFFPHLVALKKEREFVLCGDINIAHQQIDLKNWRSNQKNSGFLPEERAWMTKLLDAGAEGAGLVDVYRML